MSQKAKKTGKQEDTTDPLQADIRRYAEVIEELSKRAPGQLAPHVKRAAPLLATALAYFLVVLPHLLKAFGMVQAFVADLPEKVIYASLGFAVCFFGGIFPATIAAVEAWRLCGGADAWACLLLLHAELRKVHAAHQEDEKKDANKDGKPDVQQVTPQELVLRKAQVVLKTVEPEKVSHGVVGLCTAWIGVLAILKVNFARTVTLGERVGEELYRHVSKYEATIAEAVPEEYRKWVPVVMRWSMKAVVVTVAWWIQRVIAAVHSAIRGGRTFGKYLVDFLHEKKVLNLTADQQYLDEAIGWGIAVAGLIFQFSMGFGVPFPLNLLLWPAVLLEQVIVWSVSMM